MTNTSATLTAADRARTATTAADAHWSILRRADSFTTIGRTITGYENGHLVLLERQQLTVFSDGRILFYYTDELAGGAWQRLKDTDSILRVVAQPARTDTVEY